VSDDKKVDLPEVRKALRRLDEIAAEHPALLEEGPTDRQAWIETLQEIEKMPRRAGEPTKQVAFRLPVSLIARVDVYVEILSQENPGVALTRADAVRLLLNRGLDQLGVPVGEKPTPKRKPRSR